MKTTTNPSQKSKPSAFKLVHTKHLPADYRDTFEAIIEYAEIPRGSKIRRDTKGYINRLTESVACRVGLRGLVPKYDLVLRDQFRAKNDDRTNLIKNFTEALGGYGSPADWRVLPCLGAQGIYKSRYGWIAWRCGGASNPYAELVGTVDASMPLSQLSLRRVE